MMSKILIDEATVKLALEAAYLAGWNASGEGYNAEYPFGDHARNPEEDAAWIKDRDNALREALAEQPVAEDSSVAQAAKQPAQQEPVAVVSGYYGGQCVILPIDPARIFNSNTALYTSPQPAQRTWVGLTDEEVMESWEEIRDGDWAPDFYAVIEDKLKEKNT